MKRFKKYLKIILNIVLISSISIYVCFFAIKKANNYELYSEQKINNKIYTIWHIETFEGGSKARIDYLKNIAKDIEKNNDGILFYIKTIKPENLQGELNLSKPDILSFGFGVGKIVLPYLISLDKTYDVRYELVESGMFNNKLYAIPFIVSGYAEIYHSPNYTKLHCGKNNYTKPENIYNNYNLKLEKVETQYEAYKSFIYDNNAKLLGTARDVFRVNNLNNTGRTNASILPNNTYTDLLQYIAITNSDNIINSFLDKTFSVTNQTSLTTYSLFSSLHNKIYFSGIYNDMENAIFNCKIARVFDV